MAYMRMYEAYIDLNPVRSAVQVDNLLLKMVDILS